MLWKPYMFDVWFLLFDFINCGKIYFMSAENGERKIIMPMVKYCCCLCANDIVESRGLSRGNNLRPERGSQRSR